MIDSKWLSDNFQFISTILLFFQCQTVSASSVEVEITLKTLSDW